MTLETTRMSAEANHLPQLKAQNPDQIVMNKASERGTKNSHPPPKMTTDITSRLKRI